MRRAVARLALAMGLCLAQTGAPSAQQGCAEDAMIVFDGSGSMAEIGFNQIGVPRISEARAAIRRVLPEVAALRRIGLVTYGPGGDRTCRNLDLRFPPQWRAAPRVIAEIDALRPAGGTPLTAGVMMAAEALEFRRKPGTVVLVTDGDETCGGAPCQLAATLAAEAPGLTVHVIGFKVRGRHFSWENPDYTDAVSVARCMADRTGGRYVRAETLDALIGALRVTLGCNVFGNAPASGESAGGKAGAKAAETLDFARRLK
jgi:Ca-activated chloride channel family protein